MIDIAYEIAEYIQDNFSYVLETDLYVGQIPDTTSGIMVKRNGGTLNNYIPVEQTVTDIYARYTSASEAITKLEALKRFMHRMIDTETTNTVIYSMIVLGDIEEVSRDLQGYKIYKFSLLVTHRDNNLIS